MFFLLDLNELGRIGCYVHVATERRTWTGKTRLIGATDIQGVPCLAICTVQERTCWVKQEAVTWLGITPAPYPHPPEGRYI